MGKENLNTKGDFKWKMSYVHCSNLGRVLTYATEDRYRVERPPRREERFEVTPSACHLLKSHEKRENRLSTIQNEKPNH